MAEPLPCAPNPCSTCPYRVDTPPGVWHHSEYEKLPEFDAVEKMALSVFLCHLSQKTGPTVCRGWLSVHPDSLAVRLAMLKGEITPAQRDAPVAVELYASGAEACAAGLAGIEHPEAPARRAIQRLARWGQWKDADDE